MKLFGKRKDSSTQTTSVKPTTDEQLRAYGEFLHIMPVDIAKRTDEYLSRGNQAHTETTFVENINALCGRIFSAGDEEEVSMLMFENFVHSNLAVNLPAPVVAKYSSLADSKGVWQKSFVSTLIASTSLGFNGLSHYIMKPVTAEVNIGKWRALYNDCIQQAASVNGHLREVTSDSMMEYVLTQRTSIYDLVCNIMDNVHADTQPLAMEVISYGLSKGVVASLFTAGPLLKDADWSITRDFCVYNLLALANYSFKENKNVVVKLLKSYNDLIELPIDGSNKARKLLTTTFALKEPIIPLSEVFTSSTSDEMPDISTYAMEHGYTVAEFINLLRDKYAPDMYKGADDNTIIDIVYPIYYSVNKR